MRSAIVMASSALVLACPLPAFAQRDEQPAPNTIHAEAAALGPMWYSINYERRVLEDVGARVGVGSFEDTRFGFPENGISTATYLTVPLTVSYLGIRGRRSTFELGAGAILAVRSRCQQSGEWVACGRSFRPMVTGFVGYRLHPIGWGINFRVGLTLVGGQGLSAKGGDLTVDYSYDNGDRLGVVPGPYLSVGGSF